MIVILSTLFPSVCLYDYLPFSGEKVVPQGEYDGKVVVEGNQEGRQLWLKYIF